MAGEHGLAGRGLAVQHAHQRGDCVVAAEFKLIIYRSKLRFAADAELRIVVADNSKLRRNVKIHSLGVFQRADCQFIIPGDDRVEREPLGSKGEKLFLCLRDAAVKKNDALWIERQLCGGERLLKALQLAPAAVGIRTVKE